MSAPSRAIFHKNNEVIDECFINCGWFYDELKTLKQIFDYIQTKPIDYDKFVAYGVSYELTKKELFYKIKELEEERRNEIKKNVEEIKEISIPASSKIDINSSDILDVQPMFNSTFQEMLDKGLVGIVPVTAPTGKVFKLRFSK